jgi:hypothetical protein
MTAAAAAAAPSARAAKAFAEIAAERIFEAAAKAASCRMGAKVCGKTAADMAAKGGSRFTGIKSPMMSMMDSHCVLLQ